MTMPYYVAPEQIMKDRADYARKGIARGRAMVAVHFADGIALVAENPSNTLRKISEIYDRIAFAGVGKYPPPDNHPSASSAASDVYKRQATSTRATMSMLAGSPISTPRSSVKCSPTR